MIVLTVNSGSTSIKLAVYEAVRDKQPVCLHSERHGGDVDPDEVLQALTAKLDSPPQAVARRVVHGGTRFVGATRIKVYAVAIDEELTLVNAALTVQSTA